MNLFRLTAFARSDVRQPAMLRVARRARQAALGILVLLAAPPARAQVAGTVEAYDPNVAGTVFATAVQPDGKMIIGGSFSTVGGAAHANLARLNADGSVDASFTASTNSDVDAVAVQADGKIVLGGAFTTVNGTTRNRIARLNGDGSLESTATFNPGTGADSLVYGVAVQADGKLVLGGFFTTVNGTTRNRIARLNGDGSLESTATFNPGTGADGGVYSVAVQADGKIVLGGVFTTVNGTAINRIARLNGDGSLESTATFNPGAGADNFVYSVAVQADGKIVLGGNFSKVNGTTRNRIARLNANGSLESTATFNPGTGANVFVYSVAVQADGKIVLGGGFTTINVTARNYIARLNADGTLESTATFNPGTGANDIVRSVAVQADGKIVLGGFFTTVNGTAHNCIARLANDPAPQTVSAPDATQALWSRGGSAPEVSQVTFELSTDGGTVWTPLGAGTRVGTTANWQRTGLSLPATGQFRARGRTTGGYQNGSSGLVQTVSVYSIPAEIIVQQPVGTGLTNNASTVAFGTAIVGTAAAVKTFTVRNDGSSTLAGLAPTSNSAEFAVNTAGFPVSLAYGASATFTVTFTPALAGAKTATLSIASNDSYRNPFTVALTGQGLSFTDDTDGDGLNDASEFQMSALGFDWQVAQPALVSAYFSAANGAGLFTTAQVQALHVGTPLISRDVATGQFKLTIGVEKSTTLAPASFGPFPMTGLGTSTVINGSGKLEFQFTVPDNTAFFLLKAQ